MSHLLTENEKIQKSSPKTLLFIFPGGHRQQQVLCLNSGSTQHVIHFHKLMSGIKFCRNVSSLSGWSLSRGAGLEELDAASVGMQPAEERLRSHPVWPHMSHCIICPLQILH